MTGTIIVVLIVVIDVNIYIRLVNSCGEHFEYQVVITAAEWSASYYYVGWPAQVYIAVTTIIPAQKVIVRMLGLRGTLCRRMARKC